MTGNNILPRFTVRFPDHRVNGLTFDRAGTLCSRQNLNRATNNRFDETSFGRSQDHIENPQNCSFSAGRDWNFYPAIISQQNYGESKIPSWAPKIVGRFGWGLNAGRENPIETGTAAVITLEEHLEGTFMPNSIFSTRLPHELLLPATERAFIDLFGQTRGPQIWTALTNRRIIGIGGFVDQQRYPALDPRDPYDIAAVRNELQRVCFNQLEINGVLSILNTVNPDVPVFDPRKAGDWIKEDLIFTAGEDTRTQKNMLWYVNGSKEIALGLPGSTAIEDTEGKARNQEGNRYDHTSIQALGPDMVFSAIKDQYKLQYNPLDLRVRNAIRMTYKAITEEITGWQWYRWVDAEVIRNYLPVMFLATGGLGKAFFGAMEDLIYPIFALIGIQSVSWGFFSAQKGFSPAFTFLKYPALNNTNLPRIIKGNDAVDKGKDPTCGEFSSSRGLVQTDMPKYMVNFLNILQFPQKVALGIFAAGLFSSGYHSLASWINAGWLAYQSYGLSLSKRYLKESNTTVHTMDITSEDAASVRAELPRLNFDRAQSVIYWLCKTYKSPEELAKQEKLARSTITDRDKLDAKIADIRSCDMLKIRIGRGTVAKSRIPDEGDLEKTKGLFEDPKADTLVFRPNITDGQIDWLDIKPKTKDILKQAHSDSNAPVIDNSSLVVSLRAKYEGYKGFALALFGPRSKKLAESARDRMMDLIAEKSRDPRDETSEQRTDRYIEVMGMTNELERQMRDFYQRYYSYTFDISDLLPKKDRETGRAGKEKLREETALHDMLAPLRQPVRTGLGPLLIARINDITAIPVATITPASLSRTPGQREGVLIDQLRINGYIDRNGNVLPKYAPANPIDLPAGPAVTPAELATITAAFARVAGSGAATVTYAEKLDRIRKIGAKASLWGMENVFQSANNAFVNISRRYY
ncbi:MAG: hypothetical protein NTZ10_06020 [Candidatus Saganbacteria bacterium]|nr:hypothetical protein [Candidatus Saganbacteria bacterium]